MRAIVFDGKLSVREVPAPRLKKGHALVRVSMAGICNTDVEIARGYMGFTGIIGHEFVGVVEKCEDKSLVGKRVVGEINAGCGKCEWCKSGMSRHCPRRTVIGIFNRDGAFADYVLLPIGNLHPVSRRVPDEIAVFTEPVAACFEILDQVKIRPEHKVAVIGDGKLGALAAQVLSARAGSFVLLGKHADKLSRIKKYFDIETASADSFKPGSFDIIIECSGSPTGLDTATSLLKPRGTLVLKSTFHEKPCIDTSLWVINELTIVGSRCGRFAPAMAALKSAAVKPLPLIDGVFPASKAVKAFDYAQKKGVFKVLLKFDE